MGPFIKLTDDLERVALYASSTSYYPGPGLCRQGFGMLPFPASVILLSSAPIGFRYSVDPGPTWAACLSFWSCLISRKLMSLPFEPFLPLTFLPALGVVPFFFTLPGD